MAASASPAVANPASTTSPAPTIAPRIPPTLPPQPPAVTSYWESATADAATRHGIDPQVLIGLIRQESGYAPDVISGQRKSSAGALGIAQFMPATAASYGIDPLNPTEALDGAARYISDNLRQFNGDYRAALAAYNAGAGTVQKAQAAYGADWEQHLPAETQQYLGAILGAGGTTATASANPAALAQPYYQSQAAQGTTALAGVQRPQTSLPPPDFPQPTQPLVGSVASGTPYSPANLQPFNTSTALQDPSANGIAPNQGSGFLDKLQRLRIEGNGLTTAPYRNADVAGFSAPGGPGSVQKAEERFQQAQVVSAFSGAAAPNFFGKGLLAGKSAVAAENIASVAAPKLAEKANLPYADTPAGQLGYSILPSLLAHGAPVGARGASKVLRAIAEGGGTDDELAALLKASEEALKADANFKPGPAGAAARAAFQKAQADAAALRAEAEAAARRPYKDTGHLRKVAGQLADAMDKLSGDSAPNTLKQAIDEAEFSVPKQPLPPDQPGLFGDQPTQPTFEQAAPSVGNIPADQPPVQTLGQLRTAANRARPQYEGSGSSIPPPNKPTINAQGGFDWQPGQPFLSKAMRAAGDAITVLPRALQTAFDYSYPLRQGGLLVGHKEWYSNFAKGLRALTNENYATAREAAYNAAPYNPKNLELTSWKPSTKFTGREEEFISRLTNIIPGLKQSARGATVFINGLRSDLANQFVRSQLRHGRTLAEVMPDAEVYANYLNRATGRGNLGNLETSVGALNQFFYGARRNIAMVQAPGYLFNTAHPAVAREAMKDFTSFFGIGAATLGLAHLAGADVGLDPDSADFGKIKVGNTRVDIWGGYQQLARVVYKTINGEIKDPGAPAFFDAWLPFLGNKLSPQASAAVSASPKLREAFQPGREPLGSPTQLGDLGGPLANAAYEGLVPLAAQGLIEAIQEDGARGGALATTGLFGTGTQTYTASADIGKEQVQQGVLSGDLPKTYLDVNGQSQPVGNLSDLRAADPLAYDNFLKENPSVAAERLDSASDVTKKVRARQAEDFKNQTERDDTLLATAPDQWRKATGDARARNQAYIDGLYAAAGEYSRPPTSLLDVANNKYHEAIVSATHGDTVDWDAVDKSLASFPQPEQDLLFKSRLAGETPAYQDYIKALTKLVPYFEQRDAGWQKITAGTKLAEYKTLDDFRTALVGQLRQQGLPYTIAKAEADKGLAPFDKALQPYSMDYLVKNPRLVYDLDHYGFFVPTALRPLLLVGVQGGR